MGGTLLRLQGIHARNFLSFDSLDWTDLDRPLTVVVGPNGAGKSNLLRVVGEIIIALASFSLPPDWESVGDPRNIDAGDRMCEAWIDIKLTSSEEREALRDYISAALVHAQHLDNIPIEGGPSVRADQDRLIRWARILDDRLDHTVLAPLYQGSLGSRWRAGEAEPFVNYYRFQVAGRSYYLLLHQTQAAISPHLPDRPLGGLGGRQLAQHFILRLRPGQRVAATEFLTGQRDAAPNMRLTLSQLLPAQKTDVNVVLSVSASAPETATQIGDRLASRFGVLGQYGTAMPLATMLQGLLREAIILTENRRMPPRRTYKSTTLLTGDVQLRDGRDLPLYLLRLHTGNGVDRERFNRIQRVFERLTNGKRLDVRLEPPTARTLVRYPGREVKELEDVVVQAIVWSGDRAIPLVQCGAGTIELALLACLTALPEDRVVLLDEPGSNLHPDVQRRLMRELRDTSGQTLMITHSPYLLDPSRLDGVFRAYLEHFATRLTRPPASLLTSRVPGVSALIQRAPEVLELLFASVVVLVDGDADQAAVSAWFPRVVGGGGTLADRNIRLHAIDGKPNLPNYLRYLRGFQIPWVVLCDGDSLGDDYNVLDALRQAGLPVPERISFEQDRKVLEGFGVFVMGDSPSESLETLLEQYKDEAPKHARHTNVTLARWVAQEKPVPMVAHALIQATLDKLT